MNVSPVLTTAWRPDPFVVPKSVPNPEHLEVSGAAILAVLDGATAFECTIGRSFARYGIVDIQADQWYPQPAWVMALRDINQSIGPRTLFAIGRRMQTGALPRGTEGLHRFFSELDAVHQARHRQRGPHRWAAEGGAPLDGVGHFHYVARGERHIQMVNDLPYPSRFDHGLLQGLAEKIDQNARVEHDPLRPCRQEGASSCTFQVIW